MTRKDIRDGIIPLGYQHQADAVISQANPVSTTLYEVLATTKNVRIICVNALIAWAVTQPTPLEVIITVDGNSLVYSIANPVSNQNYEPYHLGSQSEANQLLTTIGSYQPYRAFLLEGRSVKIEARITWATTQPTPLTCRVKWAKIP